MAARVGWIYRDAHFYVDPENGQLKPKYFLVLAAPSDGDFVISLLTSRYSGLRPETPPCSHGDPYPGFFLGIPGKPLGQKTWLDLRHTPDLDPWDFDRYAVKSRISEVMVLSVQHFRACLTCAAGADDTTRQQEKLIRDVLAGLP